MAKRQARNRINATGRSQTTRFVRLDHRILNSNAYRALSPNDRSLLVEMVMLYNGENNGSLYLSVRDAAARMGVADLSAATKSFQSLQALGFIELTEEGHFCVKASDRSRARCWRLTWEAGPGRKLPSSEFLAREPLPQSRQRRRMERGLRAIKAFRRSRDSGKFPVLDSNTAMEFPRGLAGRPVSESETLKVGNGSFAPKLRVSDSATHIATPWGLGAKECLLGWWRPSWPQSTVGLAALAVARVRYLSRVYGRSFG